MSTHNICFLGKNKVSKGIIILIQTLSGDLYEMSVVVNGHLWSAEKTETSLQHMSGLSLVYLWTDSFLYHQTV